MRHFVPKRVSRPLRTERAHEDVFQTNKGLLPNVWDSAPSFIARKESYMHFSKKISMVMEPSFQSIQCGVLQNAAARNALQEAAQLPVSVAFFSSTLKFKPIFFSCPNRAEPLTNCLRPDGSFAATFSIPAAAGDVPLPQIEPESFVPSTAPAEATNKT
ncbi:hypothetical protein BCV53_11005 [Parageobacillus thermoglucosidasius]|uniref:Uncharacterized protein n=2 Tax=Parageobacillus thermoglucosidasius TaxID=1426 RepID=A0AAN0YNN1_PARTM|nr:hypothetical protein BCV53_11005 [Parageobacillus thermoglucosidasius]APM81313.1 hypothetical protein BCV54_11015 [Parageobacillus thermoglucosidasius]KJX68123.1 hypothetical protein WH82_13990 [Parageobacillus thermoglucosidasius]RDE21902.1 hypothetical protein DV712_17705 [Parageobacillus thermoglucosidasius]